MSQRERERRMDRIEGKEERERERERERESVWVKDPPVDQAAFNEVYSCIVWC